MANMVALAASNGELLWVQEGGRRSGIGAHLMWRNGKLRTNSHLLDTLTGQVHPSQRQHTVLRDRAAQ